MKLDNKRRSGAEPLRARRTFNNEGKGNLDNDVRLTSWYYKSLFDCELN